MVVVVGFQAVQLMMEVMVAQAQPVETRELHMGVYSCRQLQEEVQEAEEVMLVTEM